MESETTPEPNGIHPVDLVLMLVVVSLSATLLLLDRFALPAYTKTYQEFGAELPWATRAVLAHIAPLGAAALAFVVSALGMFAGARGSRSTALKLGLAGIAIGLGGVVFCFYALYAPIFDMAGKIKP